MLVGRGFVLGCVCVPAGLGVCVHGYLWDVIGLCWSLCCCMFVFVALPASFCVPLCTACVMCVCSWELPLYLSLSVCVFDMSVSVLLLGVFLCEHLCGPVGYVCVCMRLRACFRKKTGATVCDAVTVSLYPCVTVRL